MQVDLLLTLRASEGWRNAGQCTLRDSSRIGRTLVGLSLSLCDCASLHYICACNACMRARACVVVMVTVHRVWG